MLEETLSWKRTRASRLPRLSCEPLVPYGLVGSAALPCGFPHSPELLNPAC